jgi:hypothetical protein
MDHVGRDARAVAAEDHLLPTTEYHPGAAKEGDGKPDASASWHPDPEPVHVDDGGVEPARDLDLADRPYGAGARLPGTAAPMRGKDEVHGLAREKGLQVRRLGAVG